jgi:hypothetical protein
VRTLLSLAVALLAGALPDGGTTVRPDGPRPEGEYEYYERVTGDSRCTAKLQRREVGCLVLHSMTNYQSLEVTFADGKQRMQCGERAFFCEREFVCACRPDAG